MLIVLVDELKSHVIREFSDSSVQDLYKKKVAEGLWESEKYIIEKYFTEKRARFLDVGCGTGRTTIPLKKYDFDVTGIDLVPAMIENAKQIASEHNLDIAYQVGDATDLQFVENSFKYALFSNQGWTQIPGKQERLNALREINRILDENGIFVFTAHPRKIVFKNARFWIWQWLKCKVFKKFGFPIAEIDYGDRFFDRGTIGAEMKFKKQYIHIPSVIEVKKQIELAQFEILEVNEILQISKSDYRKYPPVFYVCKKAKIA